MKKFKCDTCNTIFTGAGRKLAYNDPVFGPCCREVDDCPECGAEAGQYIKPKPGKKTIEAPDTPPCGGNCCCAG